MTPFDSKVPIELDGYYDASLLDPEALRIKDLRCPVKDCALPLEKCVYNKRWFPYCTTHAIRLHPNLVLPTFVYYNGSGLEDSKRARLRNIRFHKDFVRNHVLDNPNKAETHRLGHETSEDALSWNVFVPLLEQSKLLHALQCLSRHRFDSLISVPELYLWGSRVDLETDAFETYPPLKAARDYFEPKSEIKRFHTEPDIMLVTDQVIMCIEAKFTSGNPLALKKAKMEPGAKPKTREGIIQRYYEKWRSDVIIRGALAETTLPFHSQLFRNIIFAAWMAAQEDKDWHVVNLVSKTQWFGHPEQRDYDFNDPTKMIANYLYPDFRDHFTFCSWEELYQEIVKGDPKLEDLATYLCGKTAHLKRAFRIE